MKRNMKYKVEQVKGGLFYPAIRIEKTLTEQEVKELGFWDQNLEQNQKTTFSGDNKYTTITPTE